MLLFGALTDLLLKRRLGLRQRWRFELISHRCMTYILLSLRHRFGHLLTKFSFQIPNLVLLLQKQRLSLLPCFLLFINLTLQRLKLNLGLFSFFISFPSDILHLATSILFFLDLWAGLFEIILQLFDFEGWLFIRACCQLVEILCGRFGRV